MKKKKKSYSSNKYILIIFLNKYMETNNNDIDLDIIEKEDNESCKI
jgi:hypothetical protein